MRKIAVLQATLMMFAAPALANDWEPLTKQESTALAGVLKKEKPAAVTIACAGTYCRALRDDLAKAFSSAKWKVVQMNHGGIGIDGIVGLRIHPCGDTDRVVAAILPTRLREVLKESCAPGDRDVFVILGTAPG